jgi:hypothetical protein
MKRKTLFTSLLALTLSAQLALPQVSNAASPITVKENVSVVINGVKVHGDATHWTPGKLWVDAKGYSELLGLSYTYDAKKKEFKVNGKSLAVKLYKGKPAVHIREIAKATGAENVLWEQKKGEAYILDLPEGSINLEGGNDVMAPGVPGMGQHWGSPTELPIGPIYGVEKGKLIFIEQMISQEDFANGKNHINIPGMKGLPSPSVIHTDVELVPHGHPGFEVPHFDIHHYFVSHDEHLTFSMPPGGIDAGHKH